MKKIAFIASLLWFTTVYSSAHAQMMAMFTGRQLVLGYDKVQCEYQLNGRYYYLVFNGYYCPTMIEI